MWFGGWNSDHSSFFFNCLHVSCIHTKLEQKVFDAQSLCDFVGFERQKYFFSFSFFFFFFFLLSRWYFLSSHTIYCRMYSIHDIYVRLCHFRWTAFYLLCSTLMGCYYTTPTADMYRLLVAPLPPARLSAKKSEQSSVSAYTSIYQAKRHRLLWQQQKNDSFSSRVRNIYSNYGRTLYTVCLLIACDASVCALSSHQSSGSFSDVFIIRICIGRLSSPLTHSSVIICGTLASHVTSAFRDAVESIRHVSGHILTHVLTTATTQHPTLIRIAGARFLILFDLGFMRLQSPAYSLSLISSTVLCIEFVWLDALKLKCLET